MNNMTVSEVEQSLSFANEFLKQTRLDLEGIKRNFFKIGFRLNEADNFYYYLKLGYKSIYELAYHEFGFEETTTKNLMAVNRAYCERTATYALTWSIKDEYKNYSQSQLVEMLPMPDWQRAGVKEDFTVKDIRDYKKIVSSHLNPDKKIDLGQRNQKEVVDNARKFIDLFREKAKETPQPVRRLTEQKAEDVPKGQLYINEQEEVSEFHQSGGADILDKAERVEVFEQPKVEAQVNAEIVIEKKPKLHLFKNQSEREEYIVRKENYETLIFKSDELKIEIRRLDFANGAKLYRTDWESFSVIKKDYSSGWTLHLIDKSERELPPNTTSCTDYSCKCYTLTGTSMSFVLAYMAKYKDEI